MIVKESLERPTVPFKHVGLGSVFCWHGNLLLRIQEVCLTDIGCTYTAVSLKGGNVFSLGSEEQVALLPHATVYMEG
jgi:hypothetical protein